MYGGINILHRDLPSKLTSKAGKDNDVSIFNSREPTETVRNCRVFLTGIGIIMGCFTPTKA